MQKTQLKKNKQNHISNITLTEDQQFIFDDVTDKIDNYRGRYNCVMRGYAGTGKSTTVSKIIEWAHEQNYSIMVTSPTHKANQVLRGMIGGYKIPVKTIHSYLGLELKPHKDKMVLSEIAGYKPEAVDILIIDECSMVGLDLYQHICRKQGSVRRMVMFVGDDCQLPPVETDSSANEVLETSPLSKAFMHGKQYYLTKVLRQAEKNSIIRLATSVRSCVETKSSPIPFINEITEENENIIKINDDELFMYSYIEALSAEESLDAAIDKYKMICYLNRDVDSANTLIRDVLLNNPEQEFILNENVIVQGTIENISLKTQEQLKINGTLVKTVLFGIDVWTMEHNSELIKFVGPESKIHLQNLLRKLVTNINMKAVNPKTHKPWNWGDYYMIKNSICEMTYPYALTYHKSQGSTYDTAWMSMNYVNKVQNYKDMARMLYTAITRPQNSLVILAK